MKSLGPLIFFLFILFQVVRAIVAASKKGAEHEEQHDESDEQRRMREIQERIRKKIAERRGGAAPPATLAPGESRPRPTGAAPPPVAGPLDPFGGPAHREGLRRIFQPPEPPPIAPAPADAEILERQEKLAAEMRALETARRTAVRSAAQFATEQSGGGAQMAASAAVRAGWLTDLRDPKTLRRAIVLREILGAPVGLR